MRVSLNGSGPSRFAVGWCPFHEKLLYISRKAAKQAQRQCPKDSGQAQYRCDQVEGMWHNGHLAPQVKQGIRTREEIYGN